MARILAWRILWKEEQDRPHTVHGVTNSWIRLNNSLSLFTTGVKALAAALLEGHLEVTVNPTIEPKGPRAGPPQAKQPPGREGHPTHQQSIRLQLYRVRLCPPDQDPVFPTADPHHEAYRSLLVSSIRGQTDEARKNTIPQWLEQKPHYRKLIRMKKTESYVPDEGTR